MAFDLAALACAARVDRAFLRLARGKLLVVCYHGITDGPLPDGCPSWHHVDVADFRRQIDHLARHYRILPVDEALQRVTTGTHERIAAITFDDGYLNNRAVALPVLRAAGAPATVYLATGFIDSDRTLWTVRLEAALRLSRARNIDFSDIGLGRWSLDDGASRRTAASAVIGQLKRRPRDVREALLGTLMDRLGVPDATALEPFRFLAWTDVEAMEADGLVTFGAHTVNHEILSNLDDRLLRSEIADSIATIGRHASRPATTFAYPNGGLRDFDERSVRMLREAGVSAGLSTIDGLNDRQLDRFAVKRVVVGRALPIERFRLAVSGFMASARRVRGRAP